MGISRKGFIGGAFAALAAQGAVAAGEEKKKIQGLDEKGSGKLSARPWEPFSDRKVRVGIAGEGVCSFGSAFGYQNHPNAEVVACADVVPENLKRLQERVKAPKAYASCEEMILHAAEDKLDAIYIATDAASHARLAVMGLEHGLHVCSAVPAFLGKDQLEFIPKLLAAAKSSGKVYQMNETTAFRESCYAMRALYEAGKLGEISYTEGEYFHPGSNDVTKIVKNRSYNGWRQGLPPQYYPTHSNGFYTCVTHKRFTDVTCRGVPSLKWVYSKGNRYDNNPFGSEYAMFRCEDGSSARMLVSWDVPSYGAEAGRIWGQKGCYVGEKGGYRGWFEDDVKKMELARPHLPPGMPSGGHGGSHGYLTDDFLRAILLDGHRPCVDLKTALDTTVAGVYAHLSAVKGGESLKIPEVS